MINFIVAAAGSMFRLRRIKPSRWKVTLTIETLAERFTGKLGMNEHRLRRNNQRWLNKHRGANQMIELLKAYEENKARKLAHNSRLVLRIFYSFLDDLDHGRINISRSQEF